MALVDWIQNVLGTLGLVVVEVAIVQLLILVVMSTMQEEAVPVRGMLRPAITGTTIQQA
jgi:hypothetical protein